VFLTFRIVDVGGVIVVIQIAVDSDKTVTWGRPSTVASEPLDSRCALHAGQHVSRAEEKSVWPLINSQLIWDFHGASLRCWYCAAVLAVCQDGLCCQPLGGRCCPHLQGKVIGVDRFKLYLGQAIPNSREENYYYYYYYYCSYYTHWVRFESQQQYYSQAWSIVVLLLGYGSNLVCFLYNTETAINNLDC